MERETPQGWQRQPMSALGSFIKGRGGPRADDEPQGIPVIRYGDLYTRHDDVIREFSSFVSPDNAAGYSRLRTGDLVLAASGETAEEIGKAAIFLGPEPALAAGDTIVFRPCKRLDPLFLGYASNSPEANAYKTSVGQGSSVVHVYVRDLRDLKLPVPPLPEQRKIAAILSRVDEAIAATRKVIEQTKRVKRGLLQTLMTRGIGHTRFKKTEIGEIPEAWAAVALDDVAKRGSGHTPSKQFPEYWNGGINWVSLADSQALDRVYLSNTDKTITPLGVANSSAVVHPVGTVFVSRDASVGRSAIAACDLAVSQHFIAWQCGERLNNHFLYYFLQFHKPQLERVAIGNTIKTIGLSYFKRLHIPLPPMGEQGIIADSLLSYDRSVWAQETVEVELQLTKRGLLQDLLTGRVRVQPD